MKFDWRRVVRGPLSVTGRRLDPYAPAPRAEVSNRNGDPGFVATYLFFARLGVGDVTARVAEASLIFVTNGVKIGDGQTWSRDGL